MSKKTKRFLIVVYFFSIMFMLIGATYAYFTFIRVQLVSPPVEIEAAKTEIMSFAMGSAIEIEASTLNFAEGMGNLKSDSYASVRLSTEDDTRTVRHYYNIVFDVEENDFEYTVDEATPELLLSITGPDGEIMEISGLEYKTIKGVSGFDITTLKEKIYLISNYEIATNTDTTQHWDISVTLINLDTDQEANTGKTIKGSVGLEKAE